MVDAAAAVITHPVQTLKEKIIEKIQEKVIPKSIKALVILGGIYAGFKTLKLSWNVLSFLSETFIGGYDLKKRYGDKSWALITDATDALGSAFAIELGRVGFNIILVGNNFNKLLQVNNALARMRTKPLTKIIATDLSQAHTDEFFENAFAEVRELDVSIIVNNAGKRISGDLSEHKDTEIRDTIVLNNIVPALLVRFFINTMNQREHKSAIINVTNVGTFIPTFKSALYGGSQQFLNIFSQAIVPRFSDKIDILNYKACFTDPNSDNRVNIFSIPPQRTVLSCLDLLGRRTEIYGHWKHRILGPMYCKYPRFRRFSDWLILKTSQEIKFHPIKPKKSNILKHNYQ